jgi:hypothetical protein
LFISPKGNKEKKMKHKLMIGLALVLLLSACMSSINEISQGNGSNPAGNSQSGAQKTHENLVMQTIIALEQSTLTPTPEISQQPLIQNSETSTTTFGGTTTPTFAVATALRSITPVYSGPGFGYRMTCYIDKGEQLSITGRNVDSSWFSIQFGPEQTCYRLYRFTIRDYFIPGPREIYWISHTMYDISGDLNHLTLAPTPTNLFSGQTPTSTATQTP